jgi:hypothetical protein
LKKDVDLILVFLLPKQKKITQIQIKVTAHVEYYSLFLLCRIAFRDFLFCYPTTVSIFPFKDFSPTPPILSYQLQLLPGLSYLQGLHVISHHLHLLPGQGFLLRHLQGLHVLSHHLHLLPGQGFLLRHLQVCREGYFLLPFNE